MMLGLAVLTTALLFGGTTLFAGGVAAWVFNALPADLAGAPIRRAVPWFYLFVIGSAALAAVLIGWHNPVSGAVLAAVAASAVATRQRLKPAINRATDACLKRRFHLLHAGSVSITLAPIGVQATY
ncbi:MAG: DUF4149 domain-containing protein [Gammaproteobacteria bacterium]|nr:DUF4149 domain-containing protein [Gammaproteobacteria bacterium]